MVKYLESDDEVVSVFKRYCNNTRCRECIFKRYGNFKCNPNNSANWNSYFNWVKRDLEDLGLLTVVADKVEQTTQCDVVHQPSHYTDGGIETIDYIRAKLSPDEFVGYCKGNCLKYLSRAGKKSKNELEDYEKAKVYLDWLLDSAGIVGGGDSA